MKSSEQIDKLLAEESAAWTERLAAGDERDLAAFAQWSLKSPQHMRHFLMMMALEQELTNIDPQRELGVAATSAATTESVIALDTSNVSPGDQPSRGAREVSRPARRRRHLFAAAACVAGAVAAAFFFTTVGADRHVYTTAQGEQRAVELADGSIVHLNTQSRVEVRFTDKGRDIRLSSGEALFKVARDPARPFRVHAADAVIQALGTQFNVYAQGSRARVAVLEGRVRISAEGRRASAQAATRANLGPGEQVKTDGEGRISARGTADLATIGAWRQRRLVFNQNPLSEVVAEFNRYNRAPQLLVIDDAAASRPYSGAFDADDPESLIELLRLAPELELSTRGDEITIRSRN